MKKLFLILFFPSLLFAQSGFVSSGGDDQSASGNISFSLGQIDYKNAANLSGNFSEGIQQVFVEEQETNLSNFKSILNLKVYPNPASDFLFIEKVDVWTENISANIYDIQGKLLVSFKIENELHQVNIQNFASGIYLLNFYNSSGIVKSFKIIKN